MVIRTIAEWESIIRNNPMVHEPGITPGHLHVTLLSGIPARERIEKLPAEGFAPDRYLIQGREVYLHCPGGYGNTKLNNAFIEKKLQVTATTRNWKTMNELLRLAQTAAGR